MGEVYEIQANYVAAIDAFEKADFLDGEDPAEVKKKYDGLRRAYDSQGGRGYWQRRLDTMTEAESERHRCDRARIYAQLGETNNALDWLEKAFDHSDWQTTWLKAWPWWDSLRKEPRFRALLRRAGFEE